MHPLFASREYTRLLSLPMKMRPPTTVGCAKARFAPGRAKAHFSLSFGTCPGESCAIAAGWKRCCVRPPPQPFQFGFVKGFSKEGASAGQNASLGKASLEDTLLVRNSVTEASSAA